MAFDATPDDYLRRVAARLTQTEPIGKVPADTAAVAIIFRGQGFLLIKRVERLEDPWSGQVAFPGGRVQEGDTNFSATASRESYEEVGLDLRKRADFIGYMESFQPLNGKISVVPCVFNLISGGRVALNSEVASYRWVSVDSLSASSRETYVLERGGRPTTLPAFRFEDYIVWGLTERILTRFAGLAGVQV